MITKDFENLFYEYGEVMKQIGKAETNDKVGMKEYNKLLSEKEKIVKKFDEMFKLKHSKLANSLGLV